MSEQTAPPLLMCLPFGILLLSIALMPLVFPGFWEKNRNKAIVTAVVGLPVLFFILLENGRELVAAAKDYISFIILLGALFVISGGIRIAGDIKATPMVNTAILFVGALLANFIGTTGASMLLIRPLLQIISERKRVRHIPVFFIFAVSNIGGCLTPLGDPPLFLGYLRGVPFSWTLKLFPIWLTTLGLVLMVFYIWDSLAYRKETRIDVLRDSAVIVPLKVEGIVNFLFLALVVLAVALQLPSPYRELIVLVSVILSWLSTPKTIREENKFTFYPIAEVAILFAGIFVTMVPLTLFLHLKGASMGITHPWQFFWLSGGLSSFLDNAPTYVTFSSLAQSVTRGFNPTGIPVVAGVRADLLQAISCGSVFMGANTYIGNGPNFMVKSIAEERGADVPHFFGYMAYSMGILIPVFILVTIIFFR